MVRAKETGTESEVRRHRRAACWKSNPRPSAISPPGSTSDFDRAVEMLVIGCEGRIIVTGMGKSGLIGQKIAATLSSTGTPGELHAPRRGDPRRPRDDRDRQGPVLLALSRTRGRRPRCVRLLELVPAGSARKHRRAHRSARHRRWRVTPTSTSTCAVSERSLSAWTWCRPPRPPRSLAMGDALAVAGYRVPAVSPNSDFAQVPSRRPSRPQARNSSSSLMHVRRGACLSARSTPRR